MNRLATHPSSMLSVDNSLSLSLFVVTKQQESWQPHSDSNKTIKRLCHNSHKVISIVCCLSYIFWFLCLNFFGVYKRNGKEPSKPTLGRTSPKITNEERKEKQQQSQKKTTQPSFLFTSPKNKKKISYIYRNSLGNNKLKSSDWKHSNKEKNDNTTTMNNNK